ncbi:hypothetical protein PRK78_001494 [Emydomyces testavorans]|uniref:Uncharacterized protein n=1 Tax=Emydomyces testavorans TaxID=2070801 RepID=A0AAF0DDE7_9EURO|nr:hypothetical protein PRK78_001494 [Emydomyces testavorans]
MPHTIHTVKGERQGDTKFNGKLGRYWQSAKSGRKRCRFQMPTENRSNQICCGKDVQTARENGASDTVEAGEVPGNLRSVDAEMWRDRTIEALFGEDFGGISGLGGWCGGGCCWSFLVVYGLKSRALSNGTKNVP